MRKRQLFLSHSVRDAELASRLELSLERLGLEIFNPVKDIRAGEDFRSAIQAAIRRSDVVLMLVGTPDSVASSWMSYEAGMAEALGKKIITLVPDQYSLAQLPLDISRRWVLRLDPSVPDRAANELAHHLAVA